MRWLGLDFETTGLDTSQDRIIEVGAVIWDVERKQPLQIYSALCKQPGVEVSGLITKLTGIRKEDLDEFGVNIHDALGTLTFMSDSVDHVLAHNGTGFDRPIYEAECKRHELNTFVRPWIDTRTDVPYPEEMKSKKLNNLAYDHEFINPFPHRAVTDVLTMLKIASKYDPMQIIEYRNSPSLEVRAVVSFEGREKAKAKSYHWDAKRKWWIKHIKEFQLEDEIKTSDFKINVINKQGENNAKENNN